MKIYFKIILLLFTSISFAQNHYNLKFEISHTTSSNEYKIEIDKYQTHSLITFFKLSPTRSAYKYKDSIRIKELLNKDWKTAEEHKEFEEIYNNYKIFEKDSLMVSNNDPIIKYSDSLLNSEELILKEKSIQPIYSDAMEITVFVDNLKKYSIYNPDKNNYTLIYKLLKKTLSLYWEQSANPIFNKCYTGDF